MKTKIRFKSKGQFQSFIFTVKSLSKTCSLCIFSQDSSFLDAPDTSDENIGLRLAFLNKTEKWHES